MTIKVDSYLVLPKTPLVSRNTLSRNIHINSKYDNTLDKNSIKYSNTVLYSSKNSVDETPTFELNTKRIVYAILWLGLISYTFLLSPGGSPEAAAKDTDLILRILSTPFDGAVSPLFVTVFNALGILPAIYASLLLVGGKNQKLPAFPFVFSSFFLGFFAIGPYLFLREPKLNISLKDRGE